MITASVPVRPPARKGWRAITCVLLAAFQSVLQMGDAAPPPPPHVVGPDGGTIADGDAQAQERRQAAGHINGINAAARNFFDTPVGPAYPPGYVPNFNINAAAPFNPANYLALMRGPPVGLRRPANIPAVPAPIPPPVPAPRRPPTNSMRTAAAAAGAASNTTGRPSTNTARRTAAAGNGRPAAAAIAAPPAPAAPTAQQRHQQNMMENAAAMEKKVDKTYRSNYRSYCKFVKEQGLATEAPYITVDGVNLYFSEVVSKETFKPETAGRRLTALKVYASFERPGEPVDIDTPSVKESLKAQRAAYNSKQTDDKKSNPHHKLPTNTLKPNDFRRMMEYGVKEQGTSAMYDFAFTMCAGQGTFMRMDSMRKLTLSTVVLDDCHGPEREGFASSVVGFILLAGTQKTPGQGTRVAGAWPHKDLWKCTEFFLSASLFMGLHNEPDNFSFIVNDSGEYTWRHRPIVTNWRDASSAEGAYRKVLGHLRINWKHLVHMRSAGIEDASSWGNLSPDEISTMSKHWGRTTDRLRMSYISELHRSVIASCSGFGSEVRGDGITDWYVAECYLDVESEFPGFVDRMYPHRHQWIQDADEPCGDKTDCAHNFLHHLLPHTALRLAQRGIYFIKWAPNHPLSKALLNVMGPGYEKWASKMRRKCDAEMAQHMVELGLKNNLGGTLYDMSSSLGRLEKELMRSRKRERKSQKWLKLIAAQNVEILKRQGGSAGAGTSAFSLARLCARGGSDAKDAGGELTLPLELPSSDSSSDSDSSSSEEVVSKPACRAPEPSAAAPATVNKPPGLGYMLRPTAVEPIIPREFPSSVVVLLNQHNQGGLNKLKLANKAHWSGSVRTRYSRRQTVFEAIERKARILRSPSDIAGRMMKAAMEMDKERGSRSMAAYLKDISEKAPGHKKRVSKKARAEAEAAKEI